MTTPCGAGVMLRATDYGYKPAPIVSVYLTSPAPNNEMMELFRADGDPHTGDITLEEADQERINDAMSYDDMMAYCRSNRDSDGFCRCCNGCSGATTSNLAEDYPMPDGLTVYRGGNYGSCRFEVRE